MKKVLILGGGFAGLSALQILAKHPKACTTTLIDKKPAFDFLPLLPDIICRRLEAHYLTNAYKDLQKRYRFHFMQAEVTRVELDNKLVYAHNRAFTYHYLIIASGSLTNFYGNKELETKALKIDNLADTLKLARILKEVPANTWLVVGGGYTGVELATQIRCLGHKLAKKFKIIIIQLKSEILPNLAAWEREYVERNLAGLDIHIITQSSVKKIKDSTVVLTNGRSFNDAAVLWAAGVRAADFVQTIPGEKSDKGQLKVDKFLRIKENCYAIGDTADFVYRGKSLPMFSYYSQQQGRQAAGNILRDIKGKKLKPYKPLNLGYIVPMANGKACGRLLGLGIKGWPALLTHYLSSVYRSYSFVNRMGIIKNLLFLRFK